MSASMPDVANQTTAQTQGTLDWVGMSNIALPLVVAIDNDAPCCVTASASAYVNLGVAQAKGIHMSRLYLQLDQLSSETLTGPRLQQLLQDFIVSHQDLSDKARVELSFLLPLRRSSLKSGKAGWKTYPVTLSATLAGQHSELELTVEVPYSSTCPASAALARQLIQQAFDDQFGQQQQLSGEQVRQWLGTTAGIVATPHSQRSIAQIKVKTRRWPRTFPLRQLIDDVENCLKTPVQAAVKREDEQAFALLNGQNLMFCEDAARRLQQLLHQQPWDDFRIQVNHLESLHAHDAVSITTKGIRHGYK